MYVKLKFKRQFLRRPGPVAVVDRSSRPSSRPGPVAVAAPLGTGLLSRRRRRRWIRLVLLAPGRCRRRRSGPVRTGVRGRRRQRYDASSTPSSSPASTTDASINRNPSSPPASTKAQYCNRTHRCRRRRQRRPVPIFISTPLLPPPLPLPLSYRPQLALLTAPLPVSKGQAAANRQAAANMLSVFDEI